MTITLVVVRIEAQQFLIVADRVVQLAGLSQTVGKAGARSHIWAGFQETPEMSGIFTKCLVAQCSLARANAFLVKRGCFKATRSPFFGKQNEGIGTIVRNTQRFPRE